MGKRLPPPLLRHSSHPPGAQGCFPCRFVEEKSSFEYGQVNHALAAAMRTLVKEYLIDHTDATGTQAASVGLFAHCLFPLLSQF